MQVVLKYVCKKNCTCVMLAENILLSTDELDGDHLEPLLFESVDDLTGESALHAVRLDHNE